MSPLAARYLLAGIVLLLYTWLCAGLYLREYRRQRASDLARNALLDATGGIPSISVVYASQTGYAEQLAWQTAAALKASGLQPRLIALSDLDPQTLARQERMLFVLSTYGEGDPPDSASSFVRNVMAGTPDLSRLRFGMLALGDKSYVNFCGFGRSVDAWLKQRGAHALFERVDLDNADSHALHQWREEVGRLTGSDVSAAWDEPAFGNWTLTRRVQLNPGSAGHPIFHLEFQPIGAQQAWEAGDLVQLIVPADPERPRDYSVASLPADGALHLLVRKEIHPNGSVGAASAWLADSLDLGGVVQMRLKPNRNFQLDANVERPLILIGNGTGLAGLRSLIKARARIGKHDASQRTWLVFGERNAAHDRIYGDELEAWHTGGVLERLDWVFSRDQPERRYVQHVLRAEAERVASWIAAGAAIYVCGSLEGMAGGVDETLKAILGSRGVERLIDEGRYRRDVY